MHNARKAAVLGTRCEFGTHETAIGGKTLPQTEGIGFTTDETGAGVGKFTHERIQAATTERGKRKLNSPRAEASRRGRRAHYPRQRASGGGERQSRPTPGAA